MTRGPRSAYRLQEGLRDTRGQHPILSLTEGLWGVAEHHAMPCGGISILQNAETGEIIHVERGTQIDVGPGAQIASIHEAKMLANTRGHRTSDPDECTCRACTAGEVTAEARRLVPAEMGDLRRTIFRSGDGGVIRVQHELSDEEAAELKRRFETPAPVPLVSDPTRVGLKRLDGGRVGGVAYKSHQKQRDFSRLRWRMAHRILRAALTERAWLRYCLWRIEQEPQPLDELDLDDLAMPTKTELR